MAGVTSLRYRIKIGNGAEAGTVYVRATTAGACTGTASVGQGSVSLLGTADGQWFKADVEAWHEISAEHGDELIEAAGDKWVKDEGYEFANLCFFQNVLDSMLGTEAPTGWFVTGTDERPGSLSCCCRTPTAGTAPRWPPSSSTSRTTWSRCSAPTTRTARWDARSSPSSVSRSMPKPRPRTRSST